MTLAGRAEKISVRAIVRRVAYDFIKARKEVDRVPRHLYVYRRRELRAHAAHAFPGRALALMRFALDHQHVSAAGLRQMIGDTRADDAAADNHDVCGFHESKSKKEKEKSK